MTLHNNKTSSYVDICEPNIKKGHRLVHILTDIRWFILIWSKTKRPQNQCFAVFYLGLAPNFVGVAGLEPTTSWSQTRHTTNCTTPRLIQYFCAERGGFEPPVQNDPYVGLANRWFQPLTHLSLVL